MSKKINLSVATPCHENWLLMSPTERGGYCQSCHKEVIDFTSMTDAQLATFFKKPAASVCGRFRSDQLEHDLIIPKKQLPWVRYFFQISLPAFLFSLKSNAQTEREKPDTFISKPLEGVLGFVYSTKQIAPTKEMKGKVLNNQGEPIPYATVMVKESHIGASCDSTGAFLLSVPTGNVSTLVASAVGFEPQELKAKGGDDITFILPAPITNMSLGEVVVISRKKVAPIPLMQRISDTVFTKFKVYPNPVQAGRKVVVEWRKGEKGNYIVSLVALSGQTVIMTKVEIENKSQLVSLNIPATVAGVYILRFQHAYTGKVYTQKLAIK